MGTERMLFACTLNGETQIKSHSSATGLENNENQLTLNEVLSILESFPLMDCPSFVLDVSSITVLELSKCGLSDVPKCVKNLTLKKLILSENFFQSIPLCLFNGLKELAYLDLSFNLIQQFDIEPDCVLHLKTLKLNNNKFDHMPKWFLTFRCVNLENFDYSNNNATHYTFLKNSFNLAFMKIKELRLQKSCLLNRDFNLLKRFKWLRILDISNNANISNQQYINRFKDLDLLFIKPDWHKMQILYLNFISVPLFPEGVFYIESLRELHITNNTISWIPDGIEYLVNLEVLDISNNELVAIPPKINLLEWLKTFKAASNYIEEVPEMPKSLALLDLYDNFIDQINCDLNCVQFIDLDYNFLPDAHLSNIEDYCGKRDNLRKSLNVTEYRGCGLKDISLKYRSSPSNSESESEIDNCHNNEFHLTSNNYASEEENWDEEISNSKLKPEYTSIGMSDQEWQDDDECLSSKIVKKQKVYIDDNEWTFIDAD